MSRLSFRWFYARLSVAVFTFLLSFVLMEAAVRLCLLYVAPIDIFDFFAPLSMAHRRVQELRHGETRPHPYLPATFAGNFDNGIEKINSLGYRGVEFPLDKPEEEFRILCVGGSTTYDDEILDHAKTFPARLEQILQDGGYTQVRVINGGMPAYQSYDTLIRYAFDCYRLEPDLVINYDGINDYGNRIIWPPEKYTSDNTGFLATPHDYRWWRLMRSSVIINIVLTATGLFMPLPRYFDDIGLHYAESAKDLEVHKQIKQGIYPNGFFLEHPVLEMLRVNPPSYFKANLRHMHAMADADGATTVLMTSVTQANEHSKDGTADDEFLFGLRQNNDAVRELAHEVGAPLIDLEKLYPQDTSLWADGIHNNEKGAAVKARIVAEELERLMLLPEASAAANEMQVVE